MLSFLGVAVVVVRVYDVTGMVDAERRDALDVAREALAAASVHVVFKNCSSNGSKDDSCNTPPEPGERIVRILNAPANPPPGMGMTLGKALVDRSTNGGVLATVYADRIVQMAAGQVDRPLLFGRVVAHELGHLLLGVTTHSGSGLMREFWTDQQMRRNESSDWAFSIEDRERICLGLLGKRSLCGTTVGQRVGERASRESRRQILDQGAGKEGRLTYNALLQEVPSDDRQPPRRPES